MKLLLDTSAWIAFFRSDDASSAVVAEALTTRECFTCGPVLLELRRGLRAHEQPRVLGALSLLQYLESERSSYELAGTILADLRSRGKTISSMDGLIAAIAIEADIPLLTFDHDFGLISNLEAIDAL